MILCAIDDFCRQQKNKLKDAFEFIQKGIGNFSSGLKRVATIVVYFHLSHYREFKSFYLILIEIKKNLKIRISKSSELQSFC
ncbi:hypothetical protein LEP1GSC125_0125 [Leptospira mayottensis 200901122]|uniref:Uncharacterized protein n=1 Tax=Leptospira mayottensis 200901122 TaxID=1193010 RepID=A0AA87SW35_9LEPT|nr:hypothetical protein LEP1GSC125_0125 [Leptospira mayottensis 200901122]